jgi:F-type H+-transporting ATPase subunit a
MGFEFVARTLRATGLLTIVLATALAVYAGPALALALVLGSAWSLANLALWTALVRCLSPRGKLAEPLRAWLLVGVKVPLLYAAGAWLLGRGLSLPALLFGFGLVFVVVTAKAVGLWLTHPEWRTRATGRALGVLALAVALAAAPGAARADAAAAAPVELAAARHSAAHAGVAAKAEAAAPTAAMAEKHEEEGAPELPNFVTYLRAAYAGKEEPGWVKFVHEWENVLFSILAAVVLIVVFGIAAKPKKLVPEGLQNAAEALLGGLHDFFLGILGPQGKPYIPFLASLMLYIVAMNWMGMIPFLKSPNTSLNTTFALALCVFVYVQYIGITKNGILGYLHHFAGQPKDALGWGAAVLLFPLEIMGELIKPVSLSCRLFGNILGEDILLAVFVGLGVTTLKFVHSPIGLPLQLPFLFLSTLFGLIQGLVFALLSTVYIVMMLPHDDHHEDHAGDAHASAGAH